MPEKKWRTSKWEEEGLLKCGGENAYSFSGNDEVIKLVGSAQETVEDLIRKVIGLNADLTCEPYCSDHEEPEQFLDQRKSLMKGVFKFEIVGSELTMPLKVESWANHFHIL